MTGYQELGELHTAARVEMPLPQAAVQCLHARLIPHHQGGDGGLSVWFFRGVVGCLARIRLVFGVSSLIFHFKIAFVAR